MSNRVIKYVKEWRCEGKKTESELNHIMIRNIKLSFEDVLKGGA